jgi:nitroimidazol reductase NimA-like FMN-containing flavoprotein (pyridoxamine 5'-phosphate oxidase superfamily)
VSVGRWFVLFSILGGSMITYPQRPPFTQEELVAFLNEAPIARLSTLNPDGTIHIAAVYFKYDNGDIIIGTQDMTHKVRNIKNNPQVTVLIDNQAPPWKGVLIYGKAELDYEDVVAKRTLIFERYKTPEDARKMAVDLANSFTPVVIRIKSKHMTSYDYSKSGYITA